MTGDFDQGFLLGDFEIRPLEGTIVGPDGAHHVQPKVMQVLKCLADSSCQVIDRHTIMNRVWENSVVGDEALNRCISELRSALGDNSTSPTYIQTVPRIGYKLLREVTPLDQHSSTHPGSKTKDTRARIVMATLAAIAVVVVLSFYYRHLLVRDSFALSSGDTLVITSLINHTGNTLFDNSLLAALRMGLNQTRHFRVVPETRINAVLRRMQKPTGVPLSRGEANEVAIREGFNAVLVAEIAALGDGYTVGVEIVDPVTDRTHIARVETVENPDGILKGLDTLIRDVRQDLGESLADIESHSMPLEKVTTPNLQALRAYSLGLIKQTEGRPEEAISLLQRAVQLDPEFAMAHAKLGTYLSNVGKGSDEALAHWNRALELKDRLPEREKLYIEGARAMISTADDMRDAWTLLSTLHPDDSVGHFNLGIIYWNFYNDFEAAEASFRIAARLDAQSSPEGLSMLAYMRMGQSRLDQALTHFEAAWQIEKNPSNSAYAEALIADFQYVSATAFLQASNQHPSETIRNWATLKWANLYLDQGRLNDALSVADDVVQNRREKGSSLHRALAYRVAILERDSDTAAFEAALTNLLTILLDELDKPVHALADRPVMPVALLGKIAARNGLRSAAEEASRRLVPYEARNEFPLHEAVVAALNAELLMLDDQAAEAIEMLRPELERSDLYQLHETMARACDAAGDIECATRHFAWIHNNRGRAFGEWFDVFFAKPFNVGDWGAATLALARLNESAGNLSGALTRYQSLVDHWSDADVVMPMLIEARRGTQRLKAAP